MVEHDSDDERREEAETPLGLNQVVSYAGSLASGALDKWAAKPPVAGLYMLFRRGKLTYVGRSAHVYRRVRTHLTNGRPFDFYLIAPCRPKDAPWLEDALIRATQPKGNLVGTETYSAAQRGRARSRVEAIKAVKPLIEPKSPELPPWNGLMLMTVLRAREYAREFDLGARFEEARKAGDLPLFYKAGHKIGPATKRFITFGELEKWCEREQVKVLAAARPSPTRTAPEAGHG